MIASKKLIKPFAEKSFIVFRGVNGTPQNMLKLFINIFTYHKKYTF